MFRLASPARARAQHAAGVGRRIRIAVWRRGADRAVKSSAGDRHRAGTEARRQRPSAPQRGAICTRRPAGARSGAADRRRSGAGRPRRAGGAERAAGADRNQQHPGRRRDRAGRGLQEFDRRQHHQGHPGLRAGRLRAAEMGRRHPAVDPRLRPVAQLPSARRAALHGRHSDQHRRRLRRFPGDRSDRLQICRGLQGRQRAAVRRQLARRRHQFRDADRPRSVPERRVGSISAHSGSSGCRPMPAAPTARGTVSSPPRRRPQTASATTASAAPPASAAMSAISSRRMPRRGSISTPTRFASASPAASPSNRR